MHESSAGVVIRVRLLTETSLIVHWLTPDHGRLATVAKGARRPKSPFRGKLDLFHECRFSFVRSRRSSLHTLREVELVRTQARLRREFDRLEQAAYAVRLIECATESDTPLPEVSDLFAGFLNYLNECGVLGAGYLALEARLLATLGLGPDLEPAAPEVRVAVGRMLDSDWAGLARLGLQEPNLRRCAAFLGGALLAGLERIPEGRPSV